MTQFNTKKWAVAALFAGALSFGGLSLAATEPSSASEPEHSAWREKMLQKFDTNHDGKLDDAERQAMREQFHVRREARREEMLQKYDTNHDGKLDDAERQAMRAERSQARFKALDTNGDGSLSLSEFQAGAKNHLGFGFGGH